MGHGQNVKTCPTGWGSQNSSRHKRVRIQDGSMQIPLLLSLVVADLSRAWISTGELGMTRGHGGGQGSWTSNARLAFGIFWLF